MISKTAYEYCGENVSLIENYDNAITDNTQTWICHHKNGIIYTPRQLRKMGLYYDRPACELMFVTKAEHNTIHFKNKPISELHRTKISEHSPHLSGVNHPNYGKHWTLTQETKQKQSQTRSKSNTGKHWYTNGEINKFCLECPEGFVLGRLKGTT